MRSGKKGQVCHVGWRVERTGTGVSVQAWPGDDMAEDVDDVPFGTVVTLLQEFDAPFNAPMIVAVLLPDPSRVRFMYTSDLYILGSLL